VLRSGKDKSSLYRTSNIGMIALFRNKKSGKEFWIANTHLYWDPKYPQIKLMQMDYLLKNLEEKINSSNTKAAIIVGDFNSLPDSATYGYLLEGKLPKSFKNEGIYMHNLINYNHSLSLNSVYSEINEPFTNFSNTFEGCLDYIWYTQEYFKVQKFLESIPRDVIGYGVPNIYHPSDHIPLMAEFMIV